MCQMAPTPEHRIVHCTFVKTAKLYAPMWSNVVLIHTVTSKEVEKLQKDTKLNALNKYLHFIYCIIASYIYSAFSLLGSATGCAAGVVAEVGGQGAAFGGGAGGSGSGSSIRACLRSLSLIT